MEQKRFIASLRPETRKRCQALLKKQRKHLGLLYRAAAAVFSPDTVPRFEALVTHPGFAEFMAPRVKSSLSRLEETLHLLFKRVALEIPAEAVAAIAGLMSSDRYRTMERSYFMVPVDLDSYRLFERGFIAVGEQNQSLLAGYLEYCASSAYADLKGTFSVDKALFGDISHRLIDLYLAKKTPDAMEAASRLLVDPVTVRFMEIAAGAEALPDFVMNLFNLFHKLAGPERFFHLMKTLARRYPPQRSEALRARHDALLFRRLKQAWELLQALPPERDHEFSEFLLIYGDPGDEFQSFLWDTVFELEPEKCVKAITIFTSTAFISLKGFYQNNQETLRFLIKNIIAVLMEIEVKDIRTALYRIVLKLLLGLKVDRNYLKRRAEFFRWLKTASSSVRLELEIVRFLFFEYIYIALKLVENRRDMSMTRFCDGAHRFFCQAIDGVYGRMFLMRRVNPPDLFAKVLEELRKELWRPLREKFKPSRHHLNDCISVAETLDREDAIFSALEEVAPEHLEFYHACLIETFRGNPERMDEAIQPDFWYRVPLGLARPHAMGSLLPLIGGIVIEDGGELARTDGRTVYLPSSVNLFRDPLDPLIENRNLTTYVGMALHEGGHIVAGSFRFNLGYYLSKLERPDLFKYIWNGFEDYRIERFLITINAHTQAEQIFFMMNSHFSGTFLCMDLSLAARIIIHIVDETCGYNAPFKGAPEYDEWIARIISAEVNTGRFRGLREMIDNGIERLRNLNVGNPLGVYPLARECYEIMKHWPEPELWGLLDPALRPKDQHDHEFMAGGLPSPPLTREELDDLYRQYNENPRRFLEEHGLPVYPELIPGGNKGRAEPAAERNEALAAYAESIAGFMAELDYSEAGTIDFSHRTRADDELAQRQTERITEKAGAKETPHPRKKKTGGAPSKKKKKTKKRYVYNIDPRTRSRTRISEIREYTVKEVNASFFSGFKRWEYLAQKVYRELAFLLPTIEEDVETSATDGDMNMELLIETLSDKNRLFAAEFLDIYRESKRSLEVIIGLDASGSTGMVLSSTRQSTLPGGNIPLYDGTHKGGDDHDTILNVEKAFAIIFGRALSHLTDRVSVLAFNSITSTNIYRASSIDAVSSFKYDAGNRDGDFIRYVSHLMEKSDAEVKYFFLISDGRPSSDNYQGKDAMDDTLIAMRETVNAGIKLIYFNVDLTRGDYFDLFKREATYAEYFTNPEQIIPAIPELIRTVVESVR